MIKQDRFELSSPSSDGTPLTGVAMCEPSEVWVSGDCTVNNGKGNMVATPSENSEEFCTTLIKISRSISSLMMMSSCERIWEKKKKNSLHPTPFFEFTLYWYLQITQRPKNLKPFEKTNASERFRNYSILCSFYFPKIFKIFRRSFKRF